MWKPKLNFISLHYTWILVCSLLSFPVLYPAGNLAAIDAFFFGASGSTESGLNTIDVKDLKTYQQVYIYVIPMITNLMFINIVVVVARLYWFQQRLKNIAKERTLSRSAEDLEAGPPDQQAEVRGRESALDETHAQRNAVQTGPSESKENEVLDTEFASGPRATTITFQKNLPNRGQSSADNAVLHVPGPRDRDDGQSMIEIRQDTESIDDIDAIRPVEPVASGLSRRRPHNMEGPAMRAARSMEKVASSVLVLGHSKSLDRESRLSDLSTRPRPPRTADLPYLSRQVTVGRNSQFFHLTEQDRELLGGIEYRSLKLLLKIVFIICLLPWILHAPQKYKSWLLENGQGQVWWAFYSAQTMVDNLGFTLTPDSMSTFKDATWPILAMTFLAFAGNTIYPVLLRLVIWVMSRVVNKKSATKEHLEFLLDHPRRCYTLLFPSRPTWILFGIVFLLNFIDVLLIIVLDLDNPAVNDLAMGPRILSALFQAASSRHTGTSTLNLSLVNPAVQFSLLCMMYIAIFPIAISIRASNTYEERALGVYEADSHLDENNGASYVMTHVRNQLSFDLWYIFLGTFCICIAESQRIMDLNEPVRTKLTPIHGSQC
ncbi:trk family potassium uptake protein [Colletotrichum gloeosporioides Cg-14]|uniref:Trk family potassium uptake protein n=1 Tax=Colletotrichum gloeosporioides (strain Cg-14) TaxID=1237896 RepID=T0JSH4_COLGC|nr:trk family potassium uptake protein [Colletotrichum gloeosporioides Cg-14]